MLLDGWDDLQVADKEALCAPARLDAAAAVVVHRFAAPLQQTPCVAPSCERAPGMVGWLVDETGRMAVIEVAVAYAHEWAEASPSHRRRLMRNVLSTAYVTALPVQSCLRSDVRHTSVGDGLGARWTKVAVPLWRQARLAEGYDEANVEMLLALLVPIDLTMRMHQG